MLEKIKKILALAAIIGGIMYFIVGHIDLIIRNIGSFVCTTSESPWAIISIGLMLLGIIGLPILYFIKNGELSKREKGLKDRETEAEKNIKTKKEIGKRLDKSLQRERNDFVKWQNREMIRIFGVGTKEEVEKLPSKTDKVNKREEGNA